MAKKKDSLLSKLGAGLADSVGIREGEGTLPSYSSTAAAAPKTAFVRSRDTGVIAVDDVMPDPEQPRKHFDEVELQNLADSIKEEGLLQAIKVRWSDEHEKWLIVMGERRWRAHKLARLEKIKCTFDDSVVDITKVRSQQIIENELRQDLQGIELANALKHLMDNESLSAVQVAKKLKMSKGKVSKALALLKLPEELQEKVTTGELSPATGYELSKVKDPEKQKALADDAIAGHVTCSDAAKKTSNSSARKPRKTTNETFKTSDGVRIAITSRRDVGEQGMIDALLEVADIIRKRRKQAA